MGIHAGRNATPVSEFRKEAANILFERREYERRFARAVGEGLRDIRHGRIISQDEMERDASGL